MSWRKYTCLLTGDKCLRNMKICQSAWKSHSCLTYRGEKYPQAQGRAEGESSEGRQSQADFNMLLIFQGGRSTSPSLILTFKFFDKLFSFLEYPLIYKPIQILTFQCQLFVVCTGHLHCSILPHLPLDSCLTPYFSVKMPFSFRTPKSLLTKNGIQYVYKTLPQAFITNISVFGGKTLMKLKP